MVDKQPDKLWHYTIGEFFLSIVEDGEIKPATAGLQAGETPAVWFSSNPFFEWSTYLYGGTLVRIEVNTSAVPYSWEQFKQVSGLSAKYANALEETAIEAGADPQQWWASFRPVPKEEWVDLEHFDYGEQVWYSHHSTRRLIGRT